MTTEKEIESRYHTLDRFMMGYINQDSPVVNGHMDLKEVVDFYVTMVPPSTIRQLAIEIQDYADAHPNDLNTAFADDFPYGRRVPDVKELVGLIVSVAATLPYISTEEWITKTQPRRRKK